VEIEAVQWTGRNTQEIVAFCGSALLALERRPGGKMFIGTLEGPHQASVGDYIIKGVKGEFYPCKPDIFEATYEEILVRQNRFPPENNYCIAINAGGKINYNETFMAELKGEYLKKVPYPKS
jgi:hypothetical protein